MERLNWEKKKVKETWWQSSNTTNEDAEKEYTVPHVQCG